MSSKKVTRLAATRLVSVDVTHTVRTNQACESISHSIKVNLVDKKSEIIINCRPPGDLIWPSVDIVSRLELRRCFVEIRRFCLSSLLSAAQLAQQILVFDSC